MGDVYAKMHSSHIPYDRAFCVRMSIEHASNTMRLLYSHIIIVTLAIVGSSFCILSLVLWRFNITS